MKYQILFGLLVILLSFINSKDFFNRCKSVNFCRTFTERQKYQSNTPLSYFINKESVIENKDSLIFKLNPRISTHSNVFLNAKVKLYKYGIFRLLIDEDYERNSDEHEEVILESHRRRFKFSPDDQILQTRDIKLDQPLNLLKDDEKITIFHEFELENDPEFKKNNQNTIKSELEIHYSPFKIVLKVNNVLALQINENNILGFEINGHENSEFDSFTRINIDLTYPNQTKLFGLAERAGKSELIDTDTDLYRLYNVDLFKYSDDEYFGLYGSWPMILAKNENVMTTVLYNNPSETYVSVKTLKDEYINITSYEKDVIESYFVNNVDYVDLNYKYFTNETLLSELKNNTDDFSTKNNFFNFHDIHRYLEQRQKVVGVEVIKKEEKNYLEKARETVFLSDAGVIDLYFLSDFTPENIYSRYHKLIGKPALPPMFSLGYHQSRWNYKNLKDLKSVDNGFDDSDTPYDNIWLDIEYSDEKKYMTWNSGFDGIKEFLPELQKKGRNLVVIIDPHIKVSSSYKLYNEALKKNLFVKNRFLESYVGLCWSKESSYLDFFDKNVREFWENELIKSEFFLGASNIHIWNDMNEPSVFKEVDMTIPKNTLIRYNNTNFEFRDGHNAYGYFMHRTSFEAMKKKYNKRPFVLTRSYYIGSHKFAATWLGDNIANFEDLERSIEMIINNALVGFSFVGSDVGGFVNSPDSVLLSRWFQFGVFYPFFRSHSHNETSRREHYLFDDETSENIKQSIKLRYKLLPYIYNCFYNYYKTGMPIIKPLWFHDNIVNNNKEFYFGDSLLIRPVLNFRESSNNQISVNFPENKRWYNLYNYNEIIETNSKNYKINKYQIGAFIQGGSIIPMKFRNRRSSKLAFYDPYTLIITLDNENSANGFLYLDDEEGLDFEKGVYTFKKFYFKNNELRTKNLKRNFKANKYIERIIISGLKSTYESIILASDSNEKIKYLEFDRNSDNVITIKRLNLNLMLSDWRIKLA